MNYKYETVIIKNRLVKEKLQAEIQQILDEKSKDGWKLSKLEGSDGNGWIILIFEKEDRF